MVETVPGTTAGSCKVRFNFHRGQERVMASEKRIVLAIAGTQSGKTESGPPWLYREILKRGPGDYLAASPSYPLMSKKQLPCFLRLFERQLRLGEFKAQSKVFVFSEEGERRLFGKTSEDGTRVHFGHAQDPESLESATYKAAWLDEAGQKKFRVGSYEAIMRRLSIAMGRLLITTTPYDLGWLKQRIWDPWEAAGKNHPGIDVINFRSIDNPAFPREEWERARRELPAWKFMLFYEGLFTRPAGQIYTSFNNVLGDDVCRPFKIPAEWHHRHVGMDFGPVNTAAVFVAEEQDRTGKLTNRLFIYRDYHLGVKQEPEEHVRAILHGSGNLNSPEPRLPHCVGGSSSEDEWRDKFSAAGLPVCEPPIKDVEVGIDTVFAAFSRKEIIVFEDCVKLRDQLCAYSREVDEAGNVSDKIEEKSIWHVADALRYLLADLRPGGGRMEITLPEASRSTISRAPREVVGKLFGDDGDDYQGIDWTGGH